MGYNLVKKSRRTLKERIIYVMGEKCQLCGYDKCQSALELHHIDPSTKDFGISQNANLAWAKVRHEINKCILVCSNCHREIHEALKEDIILTSSFSEERAIEIDNLIEDLKTHKLKYCKECGKVINSTSENYCSDCFHLSRRTVERPDRNTLKQKIRQNTFVSIGDEYGVTDNTIRKWCKGYNLPSRKMDINQYSEEEWVQI